MRAAFIACSFWLANAYAMTGRHERSGEACSSDCWRCANDVGLLAEEYDPVAKRLVGNFPQGVLAPVA